MSLVLLEESPEGIGILKLNRVEKLNAFSQELLTECLDKLKICRAEAETHSLRVLVVTSSTEKAFCAGADLQERMAMSEKEVSETLKVQRALMDGMAALPCPTICAFKGIAFGGGFELALACDLRIVHPQSQMGLVETRLAIIPGSGGTQRLSRLVGPARAKELIFRARRFSGQEALAMGLVNAVAEEPVTEALHWAQEIFKGGPLAQLAAKEAVDGGLAKSLDQALDHERACYEKVLRSEDRVEGLKSFQEKRDPQYRGR